MKFTLNLLQVSISSIKFVLGLSHPPTSLNANVFLTDMLMKALNSLKFSQVAKSVKIKLTNKSYPCLTFEVELVNPNNLK